MTMLHLHDHLNCCPFSLVIDGHAVTALMNMQQLHDHAATSWLIHLFTRLVGQCVLWLQSGSTVLVWTWAILHLIKSDLQLEITVADRLILRPSFVSKVHIPSFEEAKYQGSHQSIRHFFTNESPGSEDG